jgi:hypothetical protein
MATSDRFLAGAEAIAKAIGVSKSTALRMIREGRLPAFRTGDHTSPYRGARTARGAGPTGPPPPPAPGRPPAAPRGPQGQRSVTPPLQPSHAPEEGSYVEACRI